MSKILVAFDGSDSAMNAVKYATGMVMKYTKTEVTILLVINMTNLDLFEASLDIKDKFIASIVESGKATLVEARKIFDEKKIPVNAVTKTGDPATIINDYVKNNNIDSIIMGTRGLTSLKGMVLGSVSQKLIHMTDKPVTLIK